MSTISEKIARLLALASSPYQAEDKEALLKARQLMAEHKLRPEDINPQENSRVIRAHTGVSTTKLSTPWAVSLASIIADRYCCRSFHTTWKGRKTAEIGFAGLEDDFKACKLAFRYAHSYIMSSCRKIKKDAHGWHTAVQIRQMCHSYGWGFCAGLERAFEAQTEQHQEWGLVMAVPKAVEESMSDMKMVTYAKPQKGGWDDRYLAMGFQDGKDFGSTRRLKHGA